MSDVGSLPDLVPAQNQIHIENDPLDKAIRSLNDASDALRQAAADLKKNNITRAQQEILDCFKKESTMHMSDIMMITNCR